MSEKMSKKRLGVVIFGVILILLGVIGVIISAVTKPVKFSLDEDQYGSFEFVEIDSEKYEQMVAEQKSFLVLIDQEGCITATGLKGITEEIATEKGVKVYKMMFSEMRETSLYESVKFYPSLAMIDKGKAVAWLKADSDEDTNRYKDKTELSNWLITYIDWR